MADKTADTGVDSAAQQPENRDGLAAVAILVLTVALIAFVIFALL